MKLSMPLHSISAENQFINAFSKAGKKNKLSDVYNAKIARFFKEKMFEQPNILTSPILKRSLQLLILTGASALLVYIFRTYHPYQPIFCITGETPEEKRDVLGHYRTLVNLGDEPSAKVCLAQIYSADGTESSLEQARELFLQAAQQGSLEVKEELCNEELWGNGVTNVNEQEVKKICCYDEEPDFLERWRIRISLGMECFGPIEWARIHAAGGELANLKKLKNS